jgi:hypothetical protein
LRPFKLNRAAPFALKASKANKTFLLLGFIWRRGGELGFLQT